MVCGGHPAQESKRAAGRGGTDEPPGAVCEVGVLRAARAQTRARGVVSCCTRPRLMAALSHWKSPQAACSRKPTGLAHA